MTEANTREQEALAAAVCRWHHAHYGQPIPCVTARKEAAALTGLLNSAGSVVVIKEAQ